MYYVLDPGVHYAAQCMIIEVYRLALFDIIRCDMDLNISSSNKDLHFRIVPSIVEQELATCPWRSSLMVVTNLPAMMFMRLVIREAE
ncbi:hypothetical protein [Thiothrix lacustris]|uniref:hypothetical protein n=1 Tax=Thiothrix lacustris TaxID=525917 RepID=UPI0027E5969C|nr:hypothetical protein [Thiothrix lacustris]WMP17495.1 hypothetical protein RCS87_00130 [Thiothrix lacustris]